MRSVSKLAKPSRIPGPGTSPLTPELKAFIDRCVVPILVKTYIETMQSEKTVAHFSENTSSCDSMTPSAPQAEVVQ